METVHAMQDKQHDDEEIDFRAVVLSTSSWHSLVHSGDEHHSSPPETMAQQRQQHHLQNNNDNSRLEVENITAKETSHVRWGRLAVAMSIAIAAALVSIGTYIVLNREDNDDYKSGVRTEFVVVICLSCALFLSFSLDSHFITV
jgi:hypothetical protein